MIRDICIMHILRYDNIVAIRCGWYIIHINVEHCGSWRTPLGWKSPRLRIAVNFCEVSIIRTAVYYLYEVSWNCCFGKF